MTTLLEAPARAGLGAVSRWIIPAVAGAAIGAGFSGGVSWVQFQSNAGYAQHASIAGNQAEISALQDGQRSVFAQLAALPMQYVSQPSFSEFKARYEKDQIEAHDFQLRIDSKIDILLQEHVRVPAS